MIVLDDLRCSLVRQGGSPLRSLALPPRGRLRSTKRDPTGSWPSPSPGIATPRVDFTYDTNAGAGSALVILDSFSHSQPTAFDGWLPQRSVSTDRCGASYTSIAKHDTAGNATETSIGSLSWSQQFGQLGAVTSTTVPSRPATTYTTDSRGAVQTETLPGGAVNAFAYHPNGAQASYTDPANEATSTTTDLLGRPTRRD